MYPSASALKTFIENDKEEFDVNIMKEYGELGFLGCTIPEYGLPGISSTAYGLINRQIEYVDSGYRSALSVQSSLVMFPIYNYANKALKDRFMKKKIRSAAKNRLLWIYRT